MKVKFETFIISFISIITFGVIFWYFLTLLNITDANIISAFITICLIVGLIIYSLHGKGILPIEDSEYIYPTTILYERKKFNTLGFSNKKNRKLRVIDKRRYKNFLYKRKNYRE